MGTPSVIPSKKVRTTEGGYMSAKKAHEYVSRGRARWDGDRLYLIEADYRNLSAGRTQSDVSQPPRHHSPSLLVSAFSGDDALTGQTFVRYPQNKVFA